MTNISIIIALLPVLFSILGVFNIVFTSVYVLIIALVMFLWLLPIPLLKNQKLVFTKVNLKEKRKEYLPLLFLLLFLFWTLFSTFFAVDRTIAIFDSGPRLSGVVMWIAYAIIFIGCYYVIGKKIDIIIKTFLIGGLFVALFSLFSDLVINLHIFSFCGPFGNSNHYGYYLTMLLVGSSTMYFVNKSKIRFLYLISMFVFNVTLVVNDTLGCILASIVFYIIFILFALLKDRSNYKKLLLILSVFIVSLVLGSLINQLVFSRPGVFKELFVLIFDIDTILDNPLDSSTSGTNRWGLWLECFRIMIERPIFGVGLNNMGVHSPLAESDKAHNEFIQFGSECGIPAMLFYIFAIVFIVILFFKKIKTMSNTTFVTSCIIFGYILSSFFGVCLPYTFVFYLMFLAFTLKGLIKDDEIKLVEDKTITNL